MAQKQSVQNEWDAENPNRAMAVSMVLMAVTLPVPNLRVRRSLCRLETMVPQEMIIEMAPI